MLTIGLICLYSGAVWFLANAIYVDITNEHDLYERITTRVFSLFEKKGSLSVLELFPRPTPLNIFDEEVFNQWLLVSDNRTLDDYCEFETADEKSKRQDKEYHDWEFDVLTRPYATSGSYVPPKSPFITESVHRPRPGDFLPPEWRNRQEEDIYEDSVAEQLRKNGGVIPLYSYATGVYKSIKRELIRSQKNEMRIPEVNKYGFTREEVEKTLDEIIQEPEMNTYGESD